MNREEDILKAYLQATHEVSRQFRDHYGKMNLTFPQAMVLSLLDTEGTMPLSALAELADSAGSTISGVVDRLTKMGLVRRRRSEDDHRIIYVELTERYESLRNDMKTNVSGFFGSMLSSIPETDQETVLNGLNILTDALKNNAEL